MFRALVFASGVALGAFLLPAGGAFAQSPSPTPSPAATRTASPSGTPVGAASVTPATSGSIILSRSQGAVGAIVHVHGDGFPTSVAAYFVCRVSQTEEFASDFASGTSFDVGFAIPAVLNQIQGSGTLATTPGLVCGFAVTPPYIDRVPFIIVDGEPSPPDTPAAGGPSSLPNTGVVTDGDHAFPPVVEVTLLALFCIAAGLLLKRHRR